MVYFKFFLFWFFILTHLVQNFYNYSYSCLSLTYMYINTSYYVYSILYKIYWLLYVVAWLKTMHVTVFYCIYNHSCVETTSVNSPLQSWINLQGNCSIIHHDYPYLLIPINKRSQVNYGICHRDLIRYWYTCISLWFETAVVYDQWYMVASRLSYYTISKINIFTTND